MFRIEGNAVTINTGSRRRPNPLIPLLDLLKTWQERARTRRALSALDDRLLRDIGLSRSAVEAELYKPFWHG